MDLIDTLGIYLSTYIVHKKMLQTHRATKIGVIRANVQPSPLRDKQNGEHDIFRKNGLKPNNKRYFQRLYS